MAIRGQEDTGGVADGVEMHHMTVKWAYTISTTLSMITLLSGNITARTGR